MKILICNAGSTSLKFKLWQMPELAVLAEGRCERVGAANAIFTYACGAHAERREPVAIADYAAGISLFLARLTDGECGALADLSELDAVGFKTVLSRGYPGVHVLTEAVLDGMRAYMSVAPAHNGPYLQAIEVFTRLLPDVPRVGVFETAFHRTIPLYRRIFAVPYEWTEKYGIMRMGYHGASHGYIAEKMTARGHRRVISCHLGGSGSICAILDGRSIDNSFGLSLQMGIPNASRTGDTDVYLVPYLLGEGLTLEEIYAGFGRDGGLRGISGTSGDMRDIEAALAAGSERARLALDYYANAIMNYIGAYYMQLGGLDALAFTGGIGENSARLRGVIMERLAHIGVVPDAAANRDGAGERRISAPESAVEVHVVPAGEELMVVRETYRALQALRAEG